MQKTTSRTLRARLAVVPIVAALLSGTAVATASPASAATYTCHWSVSGSYLYAGYYGGTTYVPRYGVYSGAAVEAQCLVKVFGISPGSIDGIYGTNTVNAIKSFQRWANTYYHAGLTVDGYVGPATWPLLRRYANNH